MQCPSHRIPLRYNSTKYLYHLNPKCVVISTLRKELTAFIRAINTMIIFTRNSESLKSPSISCALQNVGASGSCSGCCTRQCYRTDVEQQHWCGSWWVRASDVAIHHTRDVPWTQLSKAYAMKPLISEESPQPCVKDQSLANYPAPLRAET